MRYYPCHPVTLTVSLLVLFALFSVFIYGCDEDPTAEIVSVVYRENTDGTYSKWTVWGQDKLKFKGSFLCWEQHNGGDFCIGSENVTVVPESKSKYADKKGEKK